MYQIRTDLALEAREKFEEDQVEVKGVRLDKEEVKEGIHICSLVIETENGAKAMGRPKGNYITIEAPELTGENDKFQQEISGQLAKVLKGLLPRKRDLKTLVVGLGNREVTPDSLGPQVADQVYITRHIIREFGKYALTPSCKRQVSSIVPGVMGQTGMESTEIVKGIVAETGQDLVIVIDALAARSTRRLGRTIQVTDTGIHPGSGVGNHRQALNEESLGVPVIAIGIPTVVDAATIVLDTLERLLDAFHRSELVCQLKGSYEALEGVEKYELVRELLEPQLNTLYVTPKDVDESVRRLSRTLSEGINQALQADPQKEDVS